MRALATAAALVLLSAACFSEGAPTSQVGGTQFSLRFAVPSPVRVPAGAVQIFQRAPATLRFIDSVQVNNLSLLEPLRPPARYQFWVVNQLDESARPVRISVSRIVTDTVLGASGAITTDVDTIVDGARDFYAGAPFNTVARIKIGPTQSADSVGQRAAFLVLTIQADSTAPAFTATTPTPLWFRLRDQRATDVITDDVISANGNLSFGTFESATRQRPFGAQGFGRGAIWDQFADGRLFLSALAFGITQPPRGYHYVPVARNDSLGRVTPLGELVDATTGESQRDADLRPVPGNVAQMPDVRFRARDDSLACSTAGECTHPGLSSERVFQLLLEPKLGFDSLYGVTSVLQGNNNLQLVDTREQARGVVVVRAVRGGAAVEGAVVALYGAGSTTVLASGVTDEEGEISFSAIPAARVDARIVPPTGTTIADPYQRNIVVLPGGEVTVTFTLQ
jgi:hypothetical protein